MNQLLASLDNFKAYHFAVGSEAVTPLELPQDQPGKAIRGSFYEAIWQRFCTNKSALTCVQCPLRQSCPVSSLVAPLRDENPRGRDLPRPYTVRPPKPAQWLHPGDNFSFGLTLFGKTLNLLPYVALSLHTMSQNGLGMRDEKLQRRGRFKITSLQTSNLLTGQKLELLDDKKRVKTPTLHQAMTIVDVQTRAGGLTSMDNLTLELLTPLRLITNKVLVRQFSFRPFFQRLLERLLALNAEYSEVVPLETNPDDFRQLLSVADKIEVEQDYTSWHDIPSFSSRQGRLTPIGGLVGQVKLRGDFSELLPFLIWGEVVQAGKDVVKGNGCYVLLAGK